LTWPETKGLDLPRETRRYQESLAFYNHDREIEGLDMDDGPSETPEEDGAPGDDNDDAGGTDA
jgi:hypothetical protein